MSQNLASVPHQPEEGFLMLEYSQATLLPQQESPFPFGFLPLYFLRIFEYIMSPSYLNQSSCYFSQFLFSF